jgi:hypothetical protein
VGSGVPPPSTPSCFPSPIPSTLLVLVFSGTWKPNWWWLALFAGDAVLLNNQIDANVTKIAAYKKQLEALGNPDTVVTLQDSFAISAGIPPAAPDIPPVPAPTGPDYWTSISVEVSSNYAAEQTSSSSNSYSVGGSASWVLWSVGGTASHSDATSDAASQMAIPASRLRSSV